MKSVKLEIEENSFEKSLIVMKNGIDHAEESRPLISIVPTNIAIIPDPGVCIKTRNNCDDKIFVNVCVSESISAASFEIDQGVPHNFVLPISYAEVHNESDKGGFPTQAYDVIINPTTLENSLKNKTIKSFIVKEILKKVRSHYGIQLNTEAGVVLKNKKYLGVLPEEKVHNKNIRKKVTDKFNPDLKEIKTPTSFNEEELLTVKSTKLLSKSKSTSKSVPTKSLKSNRLPSLIPNTKQGNVRTFKPKPGMCIKTKDNNTNEKIFINICQTDSIPNAEDISDDELIEIYESEDPSNFKIPMSIGEGHHELDKSGKSCVAYDVVVNTQFFDKIEKNPLFLNFLLLATTEGLNGKFGLSIEEKGWNVLRNKKYHGTIENQTVQVQIPLVQELTNVRHWKASDLPKQSRKISKIQPKFDVYEINSNEYVTVIYFTEKISVKDFTVKFSPRSVVIESSTHFLCFSVPVAFKKSEAHYIKNSNEICIRMMK